MSATFWGVLVIFVASFSVLVILMVGLVRQLKDLARTVTRVQQRIAPLTERLARESAAAQRSMDELSAAIQTVGSGRTAASNGASGSRVAGNGPHPDPFAG